MGRGGGGWPPRLSVRAAIRRGPRGLGAGRMCGRGGWAERCGRPVAAGHGRRSASRARPATRGSHVAGLPCGVRLRARSFARRSVPCAGRGWRLAEGSSASVPLARARRVAARRAADGHVFGRSARIRRPRVLATTGVGRAGVSAPPPSSPLYK
ncbi:uncharacterized protein A4U43_C08F13760 [Asparagus officinalis]|nr:uncharacterized protein A4U43_C08F13760 [Asparagus officinalis]